MNRFDEVRLHETPVPSVSTVKPCGERWHGKGMKVYLYETI